MWAPHVVEDVLPVEAILLGNLHEALRPKGALGVNVHGLALGPTLLHWQLARHAERVAQLRLARAELTKELGDRPRLDAALEEGVELR